MIVVRVTTNSDIPDRTLYALLTGTEYHLFALSVFGNVLFNWSAFWFSVCLCMYMCVCEGVCVCVCEGVCVCVCVCLSVCLSLTLPNLWTLIEAVSYLNSEKIIENLVEIYKIIMTPSSHKTTIVTPQTKSSEENALTSIQHYKFQII